MKQTPINQVCNLDVLGYMRADYRKVVEIGSSSGALAREYRKINPDCEYVGVEIDPDYAEASAQHCTQVILGNVERLTSEQYATLLDADCWVFADALEHLYDPWSLLGKVRLAAGQAPEVIACVPNAQHWGVQVALNSGRFFYQDSGLLDRTHIRWFTRMTLLNLFADAGYGIAEMKARLLNRPSDDLLAAIRTFAQVAGHDAGEAERDAMAFQYVLRAVPV